MGAVDLVVQVESPPSVASGLQRIGRAGHQVGAVCRGVLFPKYRGDLVQTAVVVERMRAGAIEGCGCRPTRWTCWPSRSSPWSRWTSGRWTTLEALVRRAAPFAGLTRGVLESVLDMLSGRYPSDEFAELRPRLVWDRHDRRADRPSRRAAAGRHQRRHDPRPRAVRGLPGRRRRAARRGRPPGRRAGRGDGLRVPGRRRVHPRLDLLADRGHHPRPGAGHPRPRPAGPAAVLEGRRAGPPGRAGPRGRRFVRELRALGPEAARARTAAAGLDEWAADNLLTYLEEQAAATRHVPDDRTLLVERFRDELGDWRVVVHSPFGQQLHAPWALAIGGPVPGAVRGGRAGGARRTTGSCCGCPTWRPRTAAAPDVADLLLLDPDDVEDLVTARARRLGAVRLPVPGVRGPGAAAAAAPPGQPPAALAAAAAGRAAAGGRRPVRQLPDRAGDGPGVPAGRLRRAGPGRR